MRTLSKILFICALTSLLGSCSCNYHIKKIKAKCGVTSDTVYKTITVTVPKIETDTIFKHTSSSRDTVIIREGRLTMRYFYNTHDSTIFLSGKCDTITITKRVPTIINKYKSRVINWNWLIALLILVGGVLAWFKLKNSSTAPK